MSCFYILHDDAGRILAAGSASDTGIPYMNAREGEHAKIVDMPPDPNRTWWDGAAVRNREPLPAFPTSGVVPFELDLSGLEEGTRVSIWNEAGDRVDLTDMTDNPVFREPGLAVVRIKATARYLDAKFEIEVTDA